MSNQVPLCSKGYCWIRFSAVSCQCIPLTPGEAQMEGTSLLGCVLTFQQAGWRARGCGCCCWAVGGKGLWEKQLLCVLWGTASREQSPVCPSHGEGSAISVHFAKPVVLGPQGNSHGCTHTGSAGLPVWHFIFHPLWKLDLWLLGKPLLSHVSLWKNKLPTCLPYNTRLKPFLAALHRGWWSSTRNKFGLTFEILT